MQRERYKVKEEIWERYTVREEERERYAVRGEKREIDIHSKRGERDREREGRKECCKNNGILLGILISIFC